MNQITPVSGGQVGRSIPRLEATAKVTGRVEYVHNLRLPGMLMARFCAAQSRTAASKASMSRKPLVSRASTVLSPARTSSR